MLPADDPRPQALLAALEREAEGRRALRGQARLALDAPDLRFRRPQRIALERPDKLRVEVLGLFGQIAAVVASDGRTFQLYDAGSGQLEERPLQDDLLWEVARIALRPDEAAALLAGVAPALDAALPGPAWASADGTVRVERSGADGLHDRLDFDPLGRLHAIERRRGEQLLWSARFDDWREVEAAGDRMAVFAHELALVFPERQAEARVSFESVELVEGLPPQLFVLQLRR